MNYRMTHQRMTQSHFHQSKTRTCHQLQLQVIIQQLQAARETLIIRTTTATRQKQRSCYVQLLNLFFLLSLASHLWKDLRGGGGAFPSSL